MNWSFLSSVPRPSQEYLHDLFFPQLIQLYDQWTTRDPFTDTLQAFSRLEVNSTQSPVCRGFTAYGDF